MCYCPLIGPTGMSGLSVEASPVQMQQNKLSTTQQTRVVQSRLENVRLGCECRCS